MAPPPLLPRHTKEGPMESFNDWGGGAEMSQICPVLGGDGTKRAPTGDLFDQPPGEMS